MTIYDLCKVLPRGTDIVLIDGNGVNDLSSSLLGTVPPNSKLLTFIQDWTISEVVCDGISKIKVYIKPKR